MTPPKDSVGALLTWLAELLGRSLTQAEVGHVSELLRRAVLEVVFEMQRQVRHGTLKRGMSAGERRRVAAAMKDLTNA